MEPLLSLSKTCFPFFCKSMKTSGLLDLKHLESFGVWVFWFCFHKGCWPDCLADKLKEILWTGASISTVLSRCFDICKWLYNPAYNRLKSCLALILGVVLL